MNSADQATETQLKNIQQKTGKSLGEVDELVRNSGLTKHSEIRAMLQRELTLGYGDANALMHFVLKADGELAAAPGQSLDEAVDGIYTGAKAGLRPIHERLMEAVSGFGEFEIALKKGYLSLRRKKQFAMIGPGSNSKVDVGINHKTLGDHPRLLAQPAGSMCSYNVRLTQPEEVDAELVVWLKQAYDSAG
jgi:hypothetical protein